MEEVLVKKSELEEEKTRCERVLNDREDVREAVEKAVIYVQDQVDLIEVLERYDGSPKIAEQVKERLEIVDEVYLSESKVIELVNRLKCSAPNGLLTLSWVSGLLIDISLLSME